MNFVAIDFETANELRNSPCSLGLTVVKNNIIVEERYWLIRPKENRFLPMNIMIHGIRPGDVKDALAFDELWPELLPYFEHNLVVAHNASFDMSVLRATLDTYQIPYPEFKYCCTMILSKCFYPFLENAKLDTVNRFLNYTFDHHHASADASACANILLHILDELQVTSSTELKDTLGVTYGTLYPGGYQPAKTFLAHKVSSRYLEAIQPPKPPYITDFFKNKYVSFTGPLRTMSRFDAITMVENNGGFYRSSVSKKTNVLITNVSNIWELSLDQMSTKLRKATGLIKAGQSIRIMSEEEFLALGKE